jgi:RHS repeat-associated protein
LNSVLADEAANGVLAGVRWPLFDHKGSVRRLVKDCSTIVADFDYDSFGRQASGGGYVSPAAVDFLFGYAGGIYDPETGNQYHEARYYDSALGRFLSEDPSSFAGGDANLYRYAEGDPVNNYDPEGLAARLLGASIWGLPGIGGSIFGSAGASNTTSSPSAVSAPPSNFGSSFPSLNPFGGGGSVASPSFNLGTTASTIAAGNYSLGLVSNGVASRPSIEGIRVPLTEQQGRRMREQDQIQQLVNDGVRIIGLDTPATRQRATEQAWSSDNWLTTWAYEANYGIGRVFGDSQRFSEVEPESIRAMRTAQDVSNTTAAVALAASGGLGARGSVPRASSGFVPLAEVEASAARLRSPSKSIHGNSLDYVGETHVYAIRGPEGVHKIGQSMQGVRASDAASIRAESQVRALNKQFGPGYYSEIRTTLPDKASARTYETQVIERFRSMFGQQSLPGNRTNR